MKLFISLMCLMSLSLAEPPVGDGYPESRSRDGDHHHAHHEPGNLKSLSQEYGPPSDDVVSARNSPNGYESNAPNARSSLNTRGQSPNPPPKVRVSFNQKFASAAARSSAQDHKDFGVKSPSQGYAPNARRGISQEYGQPTAKSLSQTYGVPPVASARTLSTEYGIPNARSIPSQEYGVPIVDARSNQQSKSPVSNLRNVPSVQRLPQDYSVPAARSQFQTEHQSHGFAAPSSRFNNVARNDASNPASRSGPSSSYGAPSSRSLSTSHEISSARTSQKSSLSGSYAALTTRALPQKYGAPAARSNLMTQAVPSSYTSARSSPSSSYLPAARNAMPSEQYGVPEQRDAASQGYDYARAKALEELQNQEPANYDFGYQIEDQESGSDFGHTETREENRAEGSYFVVLPDGTKQTVEYEADERGFKPRISVEPADGSGGYDENAADVSRAAADGPY